MGLLSVFAVSSGPNVDIAPGVVFTIGGWPITNAILYGWICSAALIIALIMVARRVTVHPRGGFIQIVEFIAEFVRNIVETAFENKSLAVKYVPYFLSVFILFFTVNWLGLLPFTRDAFHSGGVGLLKPFTADLNATFAAAVVTMGYVYVSSVRESGGFLRYMRHFFVGSPKNPMFLLVGILEMISDASRVISLSLRLFLNVAIGEMIIAVFQWLGHIVGPVLGAPFWLFDAFDLALQAYIFVILSVYYLAIAVNHAGETEEEYNEAEGLLKDDKHENLTRGGQSGKMEPEAARG